MSRLQNILGILGAFAFVVLVWWASFGFINWGHNWLHEHRPPPTTEEDGQ